MSEEDTVMSGVDQTNDESLLTQLVNDNDENSTDTDDDTEPVSVVRYPELLCSSLVPRNCTFLKSSSFIFFPLILLSRISGYNFQTYKAGVCVSVNTPTLSTGGSDGKRIHCPEPWRAFGGAAGELSPAQHPLHPRWQGRSRWPRRN